RSTTFDNSSVKRRLRVSRSYPEFSQSSQEPEVISNEPPYSTDRETMQCVAIERLPAEMEQTIGLATWNVRFDNDMAVLISNGNAIVVGDTGWTHTPRLEQQEDGTYASAFP